MGTSIEQAGTGVSTTSSITPTLKTWLSSWNIAETAGAAAVVKIRDSLALPAAITSAADGAAGNSTTGLHMFATTFVTVNGETRLGPLLEFTTAGSKIINLTGVPTGPSVRQAIATTIIGRRIYETKAGAPGTGVTPTIAQWFLIQADASTTLAAGMNALYLPQASITVASAAAFASAGNALVTTANGPEVVAYTSKDATHLLGCTGGTGVMATGGAVTQPMIPNNTATTFAANVVDASLPATNPPTVDTAGRRVARMNFSASESADMEYQEYIKAENDGGFQVEVTSGTVDWTLRGQ